MSDALLTRLRFRIDLWWTARLLPFRLWRERPLNEVLSLTRPTPYRSYIGLPRAYILKRVLRTTRRPILMRDRRCLRQGILALQFMTAAGYKSELHFGIDQTSLDRTIAAHCWLVHQGQVVLNPPDQATVPIFVYCADAPVTTDACANRLL